MTIETIKNWPLMTVCFPKGNTLQQESISHLPLRDPQDSVIRDNNIGAVSRNLWEKGMFIDLYT
ncbi:MAG TPA: hypothetical protein VMW42_03370 [Desulfatiglandales bacterium]|nr:hypothetical protein [Desulfatiglandales bacterium]